MPTEAEWEKAARGTLGRKYPWGHQEPTTDHANYYDGNIGMPTVVGCYPYGATDLGLLDMAGNVWEWCSNEYKPYPYNMNNERKKENVFNDTVIRGGAWYTNSHSLRCAYRYWDIDESLNTGFRVCLLLV